MLSVTLVAMAADLGAVVIDALVGTTGAGIRRGRGRDVDAVVRLLRRRGEEIAGE